MGSLVKFLFIRVVLILVACILVASTVFYYVKDNQTSYTASVKILVDQPQTMGSPAGASNLPKLQMLIPTYAQILMSRTIADKVAERVQGIDPQEVQASLVAAPIEKTEVLLVQVRNIDEQKAKEIATTAADSFIGGLQKQQDDAKVKPEDRIVASILDPAVDAIADAPQKRRSVLLSILATVIVSTGAVFVYENARRN